MGRRTATIVWCLVTSSVALGQDAPDGAGIKLGGRDPEFLAKVNDAVARGKLWLEGRGQADGKLHDTLADGAGHGPYPHGPTALACLTLLHAGGTPYEPAVEKGFAYLKGKWDAWVAGGKELHTPTSWKTYEVGLTLMALEARARWRPPGLRDKPHATDVVGGLKLQPSDGEWAKQLRDFLVDGVVAHELKRRDKTGTSLTEKRGDAWSYPMSNPAGDPSNTQYAILGLKSCSPPPPGAQAQRPAPADRDVDLGPRALPRGAGNDGARDPPGRAGPEGPQGGLHRHEDAQHRGRPRAGLGLQHPVPSGRRRALALPDRHR